MLQSTYISKFKLVDLIEALLNRFQALAVIPEKFSAGRFLIVERHQQFKVILPTKRRKLLI